MSIYQMALMGGNAFGAMLFGKVAGIGGVPTAVLAASAIGAAALPFARRWSVEGPEVDHRPVQPRTAPEPAIAIQPDEGPVMVTVEYIVDPALAADFAAVMELTRAARLRQGALSWGLFRDTSVPGRYVEYFVDESWIEHQRRLERFTAADAALRERRLAFHRGAEPPLLRRYVAHSQATRPPL
jgi:quinol monooxygenase YgiN